MQGSIGYVNDLYSVNVRGIKTLTRYRVVLTRYQVMADFPNEVYSQPDQSVTADATVPVSPQYPKGLAPMPTDTVQALLRRLLEATVYHLIPGLGGGGVPAVRTLSVSAYDVIVASSASVQEVAIPAGAYEVQAVITSGGGQLSVVDSSEVLRVYPVGVGVDRRAVSSGGIMMVYPAFVIQFPAGSSGIVGVVSDSEFSEPVTSILV
jgi:hypothetical protein